MVLSKLTDERVHFRYLSDSGLQWPDKLYLCHRHVFLLQHQQEEDAEEMQRDLVDMCLKKLVS